ncbi:MAG: hypothetical protein PHD46_06525 [Eubacteriales bacterium]|nr:hypothetical protein [Eubacteriales bacterium]MDD4422673.1 hypothetical protein [Eubacteriales bacterium]
MRDNNKPRVENKVTGAKKSEGNNQWTTTGLGKQPDNRERRDGPSGENAKKNNKKHK